MIKREDVYKIGLFNKPHGIHGELSFTFTDDIFDRADCDYLICRLDDIFVPFFIEESEPDECGRRKRNARRVCR